MIQNVEGKTCCCFLKTFPGTILKQLQRILIPLSCERKAGGESSHIIWLGMSKKGLGIYFIQVKVLQVLLWTGESIVFNYFEN